MKYYWIALDTCVLVIVIPVLGMPAHTGLGMPIPVFGKPIPVFGKPVLVLGMPIPVLGIKTCFGHKGKTVGPSQRITSKF